MTERVCLELQPGDEASAMAALSWGPAQSRPELVFVHANGLNAAAYEELLQPLAESHSILAPDLRGHGYTALPADARLPRRNWHDLADDIARLLDRLDGPPCVLAGHSMGATAALLAAARSPHRVRALVLLDPVIPSRAALLRMWLPPRSSALPVYRAAAAKARRRRRSFPSRAAAFDAYRGRGAFSTWSERALTDFLRDGLVEDGTGMFALSCSPDWEASGYLAQANDAWRAIRALRCPVDILRAERRSTCAMQRSPTPEVRIRTVPGTTHFLPFEAHDAVRAAMAGAISVPVEARL